MPKDWVESRKTVCIDLNGVLDTYSGWKGPDYRYPPREKAWDFLHAMYMSGYTIIIFSSMDPNDVEVWLRKYNMRQFVDSVTNVKVPALVYLDDRAVTFNGNFDDALNDIINFKTHWETVENHEGGKVG